MKDRMCQKEDFETWYVPRYFGNCFQGEEISYMKKSSFALCVDNGAFGRGTSNSCPCSLEDFHWYPIIDLSKPNYYSKDNFCVLDPFSGPIEPRTKCLDGGKPLTRWNGYD
ncbi:hypothetical protein RF11_06921 [Thelohanellus kitauei]|uniref:Sortilin C-terminal domain-containing protein n=1 Tax=Thelohanellus kitauei TaxID=669202 RepID=A0A0C2JGS6_THEKT|nr:hypothetical protein RF11_06921 [Thelohanellus kitauei]